MPARWPRYRDQSRNTAMTDDVTTSQPCESMSLNYGSASRDRRSRHVDIGWINGHTMPDVWQRLCWPTLPTTPA